MDNRKLLKFLYKDIAEIEELVTEKGADGFDEFEIEFIQSRFKGAKQLIQILSEKENKQLKKIRPRPVEAKTDLGEEKQEKEETVVLDVKDEEVVEKVDDVQSQSSESLKENVEVDVQMTLEERESLQSLSDFEEDLKEESYSEDAEEDTLQEAEGNLQVQSKKKEGENGSVEVEVEEEVERETVIESKNLVVDSGDGTTKVEMDEEKVTDDANSRLGDSFSKDKSVNDLMGNGVNKLEHKISNSPVDSIQTAIGINDRYQYIRELFSGDADEFNKAVTELDKLDNIQAAVSYLQSNYKWKKNDISLKFVNLVKRRFPNG